MFKLLKYELKGTYKLIAIIVAVMALACIGLYTRIGVWEEDTVFGLNALACFGAMLTVFIYMIDIYKKELSEERAYLTFTLPLKGKSVVWSKLLLSLIWLAITGLVCVIFSLVITYGLGINMLIKFKISGETIFGLLYTIFSGISFLLTIFLAITLSKVAFRNKKIGGLSFVIYIVLATAISYLNFQLVKIFPQQLNLNTWQIINNNEMSILSGDSTGIYFNIASFVYQVLLAIGFFSLTTYLIDKKVDL